jgi:cyclase
MIKLGHRRLAVRASLIAIALVSATMQASPVSAKEGAAAISVPRITQTRIADGIFQFSVDDDGFANNVNSVAIVNDQDVLVFDTDTRPSVARAVLAQIRQITPKPVRFVVNSHWHPDHWSGNQVYADAFPNLEIVATEQSREFMLNNAAVWPVVMPGRTERLAKQVEAELASGKNGNGAPLTAAERDAETTHLQRNRDMTAEMATVKRVYPTLTYTNEMTLRHGGREFRFIGVTGDAGGTTVLFMPRERLLIAGDTVVNPIPSFTPPLSQQAQSLRTLLRLDFDTVVPGHGPVEHGKDYMVLEADLFDEIVRQVVQAFRSGKVTVEEVQGAVNVDSFRPRFTHGDPDLDSAFPDYVKGMALRAYLEARDSKEFH